MKRILLTIMIMIVGLFTIPTSINNVPYYEEPDEELKMWLVYKEPYKPNALDDAMNKLTDAVKQAIEKVQDFNNLFITIH